MSEEQTMMAARLLCEIADRSIEQLRAENEQLRVDAERFQWLVDQKQDGAVYPRNGLKAEFSFRYWCDDIRAKIDEARGVNNV